MLIGIDARMYGGEQTGIGNYIRNLTDNLFQIDTKNSYVLFLLEPEFSRYQILAPQIRKVCVKARWYTWQEQIILPRILQKTPLDLMHFPHFNAPLFYRGKFLLTIHDLTQNYFPGVGLKAKGRRQIYRNVFAHNICKAEKIISVSHYTKKDILKNFALDPEKVKVIYEGIDPAFHKVDDPQALTQICQKYHITKPFLLYVGVLRDHKNVVGLIQAFQRLVRHFHLDLALVIIGKRDPRYLELNKLILEKDLRSRIHFLGFIPIEDLNLLYNAAKIFVLPSFREGFGFPPLEAMACGTPVAASKTTSIPEIVGDAAVLFDPYKPRDIAQKIWHLYSNQNLQKQLIQKGFSRIKSYRWDRCARQTLKIYDQVLAPK